MRKKTPAQRIMALLLVACMILSFGSFGVVNAEPAYEVSMNDVITTVGSTVTMDVSIDPGTEFNAMQLVFSFDAAKLKYIMPAKDNLAKGDDLKAFETEEGAGTFVINDNKAALGELTFGYINMTPYTSGGKLFKLTFEVLPGAEGTTPINIGVKEMVKDNAGTAINIPTTVTNGSITVKAPLTGIALNKDTMKISSGKSETLSVTYNPENTTDDKTVTWSSSDATVATVANGVVTGVKPGTATITATVGSFSKTCTVTVPKELTGITLNEETLSLPKGATKALIVNYDPIDASDKGVLTWSSSDETIAAIEPSTHEIIALEAGEAIITATVTVSDKVFTKDCKVTVNIPLTGINLDKTKGVLTMGGASTDQLNVIYAPADTTDVKTVAWSTTNDKVATVSSTGLVTAVGAGTATVTAKVGEFTATYEAKVVVPLTSIAINKTSGDLIKNATDKLVVIYNPADTTDDKTVAWSSSDTAVATVDNAGNVKAIAEGAATITAKVGEHTAICTYTVTEIHINEIKLNKTTAEIKSGKTETLTAEILPLDTTDDKTVTWSSSDGNVAIVVNGVVTGVNSGTATITATVGSKSATCEVAVPKELTGISIKDKTTLEKGANETLTVSYNPMDADKKGELTWSSSDNKVATVVGGVVTGVNYGTATITATVMVDGNTFESKCEVTVNIPLKNIALDKTNDTLLKNATDKLTVTYNPVDTTDDKTVTWTSSAPEIATVDTEGNVKGIKEGTATITAKVGTFEATCMYTVTEIPITGITLSKATTEIKSGKTETLTTEILPANTTDDKTVTWSSSDINVATVVNGVVTGVNSGTATITATVGSKSANCVVTVPKELTGISIKDKTTLEKGANETLTVSYNPMDADKKGELTWSSSDNKVATVVGGVVTGVNYGTATITATVMVDGNTFESKCEVTVNIPLKSIALDKTNDTLLKNATDKLTVTYNPVDTTDDKTVTWTSSAPEIATVDTEGNVKGIKGGTATITAKVGTFEATCMYTVTEIPITGITFSKATTEIKSGKTETLTAEILPLDTTDDKTVIWSSSDTNVATVVNGVVTGVNSGTATITATIGSKSATCKVTVPKELAGISIKDKTTLEKGANETLAVTYNPGDADKKGTLTWSSSDEAVATVDPQTGEVTAVKVGVANITATVIVDGNKFESKCEVTVNIPLKGITLDKTNDILLKNDIDKLTVSYSPVDTTDVKTVTWTSSAPEIATVDNEGNVKGVKEGTATITAEVGTFAATCEYTVTEIHINEIKLNKATTEIKSGKTEILTAEILPLDTTDDKTVTWSSSDNNVATVDTSGKVTAVAKTGTAVITAMSNANTGISAICTVTAKRIPLVSISISRDKMTLIEGDDSQPLAVTYDPEDTTDDTSVVWTSSDENIATVNAQTENVTVKAVKAGTATITAVVDGIDPVNCKVTVQPFGKSVSITSQLLDTNGNPMAYKIVKLHSKPMETTTDANGYFTFSTVPFGQHTLSVYGKADDVKPESEQLINVVSGDTGCVDSGTGDIVIKDGSSAVTLTLKLDDSGVISIDKIAEGNQTPQTYTPSTPTKPLVSISISKSEMTLTKGDKETLTVSYNPVDTTDNKSAAWTSSDESIAKVDAKTGEVTAVKDGKATITGKVGEKTATCEVTVESTKPLVSIGISKSEMTLVKGDQETLTVSYNPVDTTDNKSVIWTSSDEWIAKVDATTGEVTAVESGKAIITGKVGEMTKTCEVTVESILDNIDCTYQTHVQNIGWQGWRSNGDISGTTGESLRLEGIQVEIDSQDYDIGVEYQTHVQNIGWQGFKSNGETSGTFGQSLRLEAIQLNLTGADADKFDIYYRVHAQNYGWLDWAKNEESAGTEGLGLRLEAIEIQLVPKGDEAPGPTDHAFEKNQ